MERVTPAAPKPKRKKRKLTLAQRLAFQGPIGRKSSADTVIPPANRMGVKVNG